MKLPPNQNMVDSTDGWEWREGPQRRPQASAPLISQINLAQPQLASVEWLWTLMPEGAEASLLFLLTTELENTNLWVLLLNKEQVFASITAKKQSDQGNQTGANSFLFLWSKYLQRSWQILNMGVSLEPTKAFEGSAVFQFVNMVCADFRNTVVWVIKWKCRKGKWRW